jgi:hypothetical protein
LRRRVAAENASTAQVQSRKPLRQQHFHQTNNRIAKVPMDWALSPRHSNKLKGIRNRRPSRQSTVEKRSTAGAKPLPPREKIFRRRCRFGRCCSLIGAQNARISAK